MRWRLLALALLVLASAVPASAAVLGPGGTFVDDNGNIHEGAIEAITAAGITRGCNPPANDRFCPDGLVTRGQMAAFLARTLSLQSATVDAFIDDQGSAFEAVDVSSLMIDPNSGRAGG